MVTTNTRKKVCWSLCGKSIFVALTGGVHCIITYLRPLLYFKCFGTHYHHGDKGGFVTPHGLVYWPIRGGLSPWALKKQESKERKSYSPVEGNLLHRGWSLKNRKKQRLTAVNQAWHTSIKPVWIIGHFFGDCLLRVAGFWSWALFDPKVRMFLSQS